MSIWADYHRDYLGKKVLETDKGFTVYHYISDVEVFIDDMYVRPEYRRTRVGYDMADEIVKEAKANGKQYLAAAVRPTVPGATESLKFIMNYGLRLHSIREDMLFLIKDLGEDNG